MSAPTRDAVLPLTPCTHCAQCGTELGPRSVSLFWCDPRCLEDWYCAHCADAKQAYAPSGRIGPGHSLAPGVDGPGAWWLPRVAPSTT